MMGKIKKELAYDLAEYNVSGVIVLIGTGRKCHDVVIAGNLNLSAKA